MATSIKLLTVLCVLLGFSCSGPNHDQEEYKVKLGIIESGELILNDTVISLTALSSEYKYGLLLGQFFQEFNYEKFDSEEVDGLITLKSTGISITLVTSNLDSISFNRKYFNKELDFLDNVFYTDIPKEMYLKHPFYPDSELNEIKIEAGEKQNILTATELGIIFNPYNINGYLAENGNVLLTIEGGDGTGAYRVICVLDFDLEIDEKIEISVI